MRCADGLARYVRRQLHVRLPDGRSSAPATRSTDDHRHAAAAGRGSQLMQRARRPRALRGRERPAERDGCGCRVRLCVRGGARLQSDVSPARGRRHPAGRAGHGVGRVVRGRARRQLRAAHRGGGAGALGDASGGLEQQPLRNGAAWRRTSDAGALRAPALAGASAAARAHRNRTQVIGCNRRGGEVITILGRNFGTRCAREPAAYLRADCRCAVVRVCCWARPSASTLCRPATWRCVSARAPRRLGPQPAAALVSANVRSCAVSFCPARTRAAK
jgi:hypothetical protein